SISQDLHALYGDFVVFKSDGTPSYHLASVLDDHNAGVTDIVRGRDLLSSSLRQAAIQKILGYPTQNFLHIPLVRN
ncbi:glutamate--tRNA ligase family protein, partial [Burkholderiales bacterium]|nr:glutamate--tRNA ligase family protein [Burkholderiales bacterium]